MTNTIPTAATVEVGVFDTLPETQWERRGYDFYPSSNDLNADGFSRLSAVVISAHYFIGSWDWWVADLDPATGIAFGYSCAGDPCCAEWGVIDLVELEEVEVFGLVVERDPYWVPTRAADADLCGWPY